MAGRTTSRCHAIVLDRTKLKEQDVILTMLSVEGEQMRAIAKGGRKPGSRLAPRTELFCDIDFVVSVGRGLGIVTEAEVLERNAGLSTDVEAFACASAICEIARMTCYENMQDPFLHPLLLRALRACVQAMGNQPLLDVVFSAYALKVLSHCGWRPTLTECVACGEQGGTRFSVSAGGILCQSCAQDVEGAKPITNEQVGWIRALIGMTFDDLLLVSIDAATSAYLLDTAREWATTHLDCRLRAAEFFAGM